MAARRWSPEPRVSRHRPSSGGLRELTADEPLAGGRTRRAGGGRKRAIDLLSPRRCSRDLDALVEPTAPGDPDSPLRWTCQSARTLAVALDGLAPPRQPHGGRRPAVHESAKTDWATACRAWRPRLVRAGSMSIGTRSFGTSPAACDARNGNSSRRFRWTPRRRSWSARSRTRARTWRPAKTPQRVQVHDRDPGHRHHGREGHSAYGIYDLHRNEGWVSVGRTESITTPRASRYASIQRWWQPWATWVARRIDKPSRC